MPIFVLMISLLITWHTYQLISYAWISIAVIVFFVLLWVAAPYGRHTSSHWGPLISNRIGWIIMEAPVLLALLALVIPAYHIISTVSWIMIALFCFHYVNRVFIFPLRLNTKGKQMPLLIACSAIFFNLVNGSALGYYFVHFANYDQSWLTDIRFISGIILFFSGVYMNWKADNILIHLRKPGETHYVLPKGWVFNYISCPNLFGELVEWLGFAILCWNLPAISFFIWTTANLVPRALSHHKWYKAKFSEYPIERKAVIPFLL